MEERHRFILRRHKSILEMDLEPKSILSELTTVLDPNEEDQIKAQPTRKEKCDKLFEILPRKGPKAFEVFVEALKKQSPHLASHLIEAEMKELKKNSEDYQRKNQALQEELQRKNEEPEDKVTIRTSELKELLTQIIQQHTGESCSCCGNLRNERVSSVREMPREYKIQEELREEKSKTANLQREIDRLKSTSKEIPGRVFNFDKDFDKRGVVYDLATNGKTSEGNPSSTQIVATRSSDGKGCAEDVLKNQVKWRTVCKTKDEENSWWCVDLTEKHALYLTHYTLRHGRHRRRSVLVNWRLEGSLDGRRWTTLKNHEDDHGLKKDRSYCTCTWAIDGNPSAFRYFRVLQTDKNSSGKLDISLSGIELYGVLIEKSG